MIRALSALFVIASLIIQGCSPTVRYVDDKVGSPAITAKQAQKKDQGRFYQGYSWECKASYYADKFHGRTTASGEVFNMYGFTAAHKSLPFGTVIKVENLSNGKTVKVKINDRGPFVGTREIDLSYGAAKKIGMIAAGIQDVRVKIITMGRK